MIRVSVACIVLCASVGFRECNACAHSRSTADAAPFGVIQPVRFCLLFLHQCSAAPRAITCFAGEARSEAQPSSFLAPYSPWIARRPPARPSAHAPSSESPVLTRSVARSASGWRWRRKASAGWRRWTRPPHPAARRPHDVLRQILTESEDDDGVTESDDVGGMPQIFDTCSVTEIGTAAVEAVSYMIAHELKNTPANWKTAIDNTVPVVIDFELTVTIHEPEAVNFVQWLSPVVVQEMNELTSRAFDSVLQKHELQSGQLADREVTIEMRRRYAHVLCRHDGGESILSGADYYSRLYATQRTAISSSQVMCQGNGTIPAIIKRFLGNAEEVDGLVSAVVSNAPLRARKEAAWVEMCKAQQVKAQQDAMDEADRKRAVIRLATEKAWAVTLLHTDTIAAHHCRRCEVPWTVNGINDGGIQCRACVQSVNPIDLLLFEELQTELRVWKARRLTWGELEGRAPDGSTLQPFMLWTTGTSNTMGENTPFADVQAAKEKREKG